METLARLGQTIATLRRIRGLSLDEAAAQAGLAAAELREAEAGRVTAEVRQGLAKFFGLDAELLAEGIATPSPDKASSGTVFLFHGASQDFDPADWGVLERAMQSARVFSTRTSRGLEGLKERMAFLPIRPVGPQPKDAAKQGHRLARQVRSRLQLLGAPIGDVRALLEDRLGVVVLVDALSTLNLHAASILDVGRVGAAALLSEGDESRARNPRLTPVYLAHELCHLLFDPGAPGCVQIALDDHPQGHSTASLLESRARGFAAEFLLPKEGVDALLGASAVPASSLALARPLVKAAAAHFKTPWQLTVWHLKNLQFMTEDVAGELVQEKVPFAIDDATALPQPGGRPLGLNVLGATTTLLESTRGDVPPAFVLDARDLARKEAGTFVESVLACAYAELAASRPRAATDHLIERLDALLVGNELERAKLLLDRLDVSRAPPEVLMPVLTLARHAQDALGETWSQSYTRVMQALEQRWGVSEERRQKLAQRLR